MLSKQRPKKTNKLQVQKKQLPRKLPNGGWNVYDNSRETKCSYSTPHTRT